MERTAIKEAVAIAGSQSELARRIGVRQGHIWQWLNGQKVYAKYVLAIEAATGVSKHDLRPDIFGPPPKPIPHLYPGVVMSRYRVTEELLLTRFRCSDCGVEWLMENAETDRGYYCPACGLHLDPPKQPVRQS